MIMHWQQPTRAITVSVERSPGGPSWTIRISDRTRLYFRRFAFCTQAEAIGFAAEQLDALRATLEEKARVLGLLVRELARKMSAVVTVEVPAPLSIERRAA